MIYALGVALLLVAVWYLLMGVRAMWGSALGGAVSSSPGITLDEEDAADLAAHGARRQMTSIGLVADPRRSGKSGL